MAMLLRLLPLPRLAFATSLILTSVPVATAQTVVDGNTVELESRTYRLWGMDAPDIDQTCASAWPAGQEAMKALAGMIDGKKVECAEKGHDRNGRTVARCTADGIDLAAAMVRSGMAWADLPVSRAYIVEEAKAAADFRGVHAHHCRTAWDWRAKRRPEPQFQRQ